MVFFYVFIFLCIIIEMFPVSSSGHLQLATNYFQSIGVPSYVSQNELSLFSDLLHAPVALVLFLFFLKTAAYNHDFFLVKKDLFFFVLIADAVTCFFYLLLKQVTVPNFFLPLGFVITGLALFCLQFVPAAGHGTITIPNALLLGLVQGVALLPGISRFASTYTVGRWIGFGACPAFILSFIIQWPLLLAASAKALYFLQGNWPVLPGSYATLWVSIIIATILSWFCLQWVYSLCLNDHLWWFSVYMVLPLISWIVLNR